MNKVCIEMFSEIRVAHWFASIVLVLSILAYFTAAQSSPVDFIGPINYEVGNAPSSMAFGKLQENGNHFLAVTTQGRDDVSIFLGNGSGEFTGPINYSSTFGPNSVAVGEFNGDGNSDLVVPTHPFIALHFGDGAGEFPLSGGVFNGFADGTAPTVGDFNEDGNLDVAVSLNPFGVVSVILGDGAGGLSQFGNFEAGGSGSIPSIAMGDFDSDGNVDLVAANQGSAQITILWGDGTGRYFNRTSFSVGSSPSSVAVGYFNSDGNPDIASANQGSNNVTVLLGTGTRSLAAPLYFIVDSAPSSVAIDDFNNDGNADIAVTNQSSNNVSILIGDGTGGFSNPINFNVGSGPIFIAPGDFNEDRSIDLAVANAGSSNVSILLNNSEGSTPLVINPRKGGDTGQVTVTIVGGGFVERATAKLTKDGEPDIFGEPVTVSENGSLINTTFNLAGKTRGLWDVVVTNPDETSFTLLEGFTIEEGRAAQVWVDIIGRNVIRAGREQSFFVLYGNRGNVDAVGVPLWIAGIPSAANLRLRFETTPLRLPDGTLADGIDEVPVALDVDGEIVIAQLISVVPPNSAGTLPIAITTLSDFELRVWQNPPFFRSQLSLPVAECISKLAQQIGGVFPIGDCISTLGDELSKQLARIFITKDPETVKIGDVFFNVLSSCVSGLLKTEELKLVSDMVGAVASGTAASVECGEAFPVTPDAVRGVEAVGAFDPNDKIGSKGEGIGQYISGDEPLRYSIFFENVETATAPAQGVVITDQLDIEKVDLETLSLGPIAFGDNLLTPPPGLSSFATEVDLRPDNDLIVRIIANLNSDTGVFTWRFTSIDPATGLPPEDPLAGFLPPNVNPPEGDGSVLFTVMPKEGLTTGTEIRNSANIIFDINEPIQTPGWLNTIDNTQPDSHVLPLPATQTTTEFEVKWTGTDEGAGIKNYNIFVSEDGGPYSQWLISTLYTSAMFTGEDGKTYEFYSVAKDYTGNIEEAPRLADATTTVRLDNENVEPVGDDSPGGSGGGGGCFINSVQ